MHFQPIRKNDDPRFVPVVIVHDDDSNGETMMSRIRSLAWQRLDFNALLVCPTLHGTYGFLGHDADRQLIDALAAQTSVEQITERVLVYGFGDGAQFAHRFTLKHPRRVAGCAVLSAGSWTDPAGFCSGQMVKDGSFEDPPYDTEAVRHARKAKCTSPASLPGVKWLIGCGSEDTPDRSASAAQFKIDVARAGSPVEYQDWTDDSGRVSSSLFMKVLNFFNEVVANPAELPELPPEPEVVADVETEVETETDAEVETQAKVETEIEVGDETEAEVETEAAGKAKAGTETENKGVVPDAADPPADPDLTQIAEPDASGADAKAPGPDDSDAPMTHGREEAGPVPTLTARERARLAPQPEKPKPKPGEGNGFFDQLLRQQNTE